MNSVEVCNEAVQNRRKLLFIVVLTKTDVILYQKNLTKCMFVDLSPDDKIVESCIKDNLKLCLKG